MSPKIKAIDISGKVFTNCKVLWRYSTDSQGHALWECECICGKHFIAKGTALRVGSVKSCGCLQKKVAGKLFKVKFDKGRSRGMKKMNPNSRRYDVGEADTFALGDLRAKSGPKLLKKQKEVLERLQKAHKEDDACVFWYYPTGEYFLIANGVRTKLPCKKNIALFIRLRLLVPMNIKCDNGSVYYEVKGDTVNGG